MKPQMNPDKHGWQRPPDDDVMSPVTAAKEGRWSADCAPAHGVRIPSGCAGRNEQTSPAFELRTPLPLPSLPTATRPERARRAGPGGAIIPAPKKNPLQKIGITAVVLFAITFAAAGCRQVPKNSSSPDFYPLGIYGVKSNDFGAVRAAGFNVVFGAPSLDVLETATRQGLRVVASPPALGKGDAASAANAVVARTADRHPGLWAWYLADEPELNRVSPAVLRERRAALRAAGANKPTAVVFYHASDAHHYAAESDIVMVDRYPVPWEPLAVAGAQWRLGRLTAGPAKPFIAVLQAFDWSAHKDLLPGEGNLRPPNRGELRCMVYQALAQGADGLFFYAFESGSWKLREHPATWQALQEVIGEVNDRRGLFKGERLWVPRAFNLGSGPERRNATLDASIAPVLLRVTVPSRTVPVGDYLLCVNTTPMPQFMGFGIPAKGLEQLPVLGEGRYVPVESDWAADDFAPYAVHIYGPFHATEAAR